MIEELSWWDKSPTFRYHGGPSGSYKYVCQKLAFVLTSWFNWAVHLACWYYNYSFQVGQRKIIPLLLAQEMQTWKMSCDNEDSLSGRCSPISKVLIAYMKSNLWGLFRYKFINGRRADGKVFSLIRGIQKNQPHYIFQAFDLTFLKFKGIWIVDFLDFKPNGKRRFSDCKIEPNTNLWDEVSHKGAALMKAKTKWAP